MLSGVRMLHRGATHTMAVPVNGAHLFDDVRAHLSHQYVDTLGDSILYRMAVDGLMAELGDPYSAFLPMQRLKRLAEQTSGTYAGIGLQVDLRDGLVVVVNPLPGTPAERAGIMTGDRIVAIDHKVVSGWTPEEVQRLLRGAPGSSVTVEIERSGITKPATTITLTRAHIHQSAIRHVVLLPNRIGYVDLQVFSDSTTHELTRAVDSLVRLGALSLMIDLRANPGGFLEQGVQVADLFLNSGQEVVHTRGRVAGANQDYTSSTSQQWPKLPIAVLVDERTASAAELFAGALQDHDRALILGLPTYGKGSAQNIYPVNDAGALKLTTTRWFTPSGRSISRMVSPVLDGSPPNTETKRSEYHRTDMGRKVLGGGGIIPDVTIGDTSAPPENIAFMHALGHNVGLFRDALASFALSVKASHMVTSPDFVVTPAMREDIYSRMQARNIDVLRSTYDAAGPLVSRLLSYEVDRYVFGADAEFLRKTADDRMMTVAQRLMKGVRSQLDALKRAGQMVDATSKPST
jgi:carboxyl-terminal processing protease